MFSTISTQFFIAEYATEGHHPMKFLCDDGNTWYLKYILQPNEYNLLANEMVGVLLARHFAIPFAQPAFATLHPDSFAADDFMYLCNTEIVPIVADVYSEVPSEWTLAPDLKDSMTDSLSNKNRINNLKTIAQQELAL
jgi:hypothetical protein